MSTSALRNTPQRTGFRYHRSTALKARRHQAVARCILSALLVPAATPARTQTQPPINRNIVVLDPAHGGQDHGTTLNGVFEKDLTLALAASLRASLATRGLIVLSTRNADLPTAVPVMPTDQRAGDMNHQRPAACIILHATPFGSGLHIATSSLPAPETPYDPAAPVPWDSAQSAYIPQSLRLANALGLALLQAKLPVLLTRTALRPLDNLTCPAIAIEVSPLQPSGGRSTPVSDLAYQRRIAETLAAALLAWRNHIPQSGVTP